MEVLFVDAFATWAIQIFEAVDSENLVVRQVVIPLEVKQGASPNGQLLLKTDECRHILVILSNVIK